MRHVHKKQRANGFGGFADALEIDDARISAGSRDDHLRFVLGGEAFNFVVVDALVFFLHAISNELVHAARKIQGMSVRQMATMGEIHSQNHVVLLQRRHVDRDVC